MTLASAQPLALLDRFYPIVPGSVWLARLAALGIRTVQLRVKDRPDHVVRTEIKTSLEIATRFGIQLIVNDYWQQAIDLGADFVHLGQEDLAAANVAAIKSAGLKLGVSTHDEAELVTALGVQPDYIALGPVYETKLKAMRWPPQGLARVTAWKAAVGQVPLVAIGGITPERAPAVIAAGADSVAVITDFLTHPAAEDRVRTWVAWSGDDEQRPPR
jgi:thiamine-phosphate pyrophosphorylase